MWPARARDEVDVLSLFEASGRNLRSASHLLRDLFASFPDRPELAGEIRDREHDGDRIAREIFGEVAQHGSETLESAVDACETVANVLEGVTLKRANGRH